MKVVVTGKGGQLASELEFLKGGDLNWKFLSYGDLDITKKDFVYDFFLNNKCDLIINCAAYTSVDNAEDEIDKCFKVNYHGVSNLISASEKFKIKIIHFSTDYVFDGYKNISYKENDITNPMSVYGKSKFKGELALCKSNIKSIVIRTSWVYSVFGKNFVKSMLSLSKKNRSISVVSDQIGSPTNAYDLAQLILKIINCKKYIWKSFDIFHFSNEGQCSWYDFAKEIFEICKISTTVNEIKSSQFLTKAKRPNFSLLSKKKIKNTFNIEIFHWKDSLKNMLLNNNLQL